MIVTRQYAGDRRARRTCLAFIVSLICDSTRNSYAAPKPRTIGRLTELFPLPENEQSLVLLKEVNRLRPRNRSMRHSPRFAEERTPKPVRFQPDRTPADGGPSRRFVHRLIR